MFDITGIVEVGIAGAVAEDALAMMGPKRKRRKRKRR